MRQGESGWWWWAAAAAAAFAAFALLHAWTPSDDPHHSICVFRRVTGVPCPGCGLTRAFAQLAKGNWLAALDRHPLAPLLGAEAALGWLLWGGALWARQQNRPALRLPPAERVVIANAAALVAVWLGRAATGTLP